MTRASEQAADLRGAAIEDRASVLELARHAATADGRLKR
jgi:hypothetical protein